ncbi:MAG: HupE/UreJ family protein [Oceanicoccus sp.]
MRRIFLYGLLVIVSIFCSVRIDAHEIRPAYLKITELNDNAEYSMVWKQPLRQGLPVPIEPVFPSLCQEVSRSLGENTGLALVKRWHMNCGVGGLQGQTISISGLDSNLADVFVEITFLSGQSQTTILKPGNSSLTVDRGAGPDSSSYFWMGIEHLLLGFDHILFVIGLVLLVRTPMNIVKVVTSFTIAHSLTLALATFGVVQLSQASIEAVIALSIVFLAVELLNVGQRSGHVLADVKNDSSIMMRYPWAITFVFGLLHGFGFAGALTEIGLPQDAAVLALLLFNVGVEVGQLLIVFGMLVLLFVTRYIHVGKHSLLENLPAYGIGIMAMFWFLERSLNTLIIV